MLRLALAAAALALPLSAGLDAFAADAMPMMTEAAKLAWAPAEGLPPGAQVAVLYGDPSKAGPFALRFKFPAGYQIPTHSHPTDELLTVLSGKARMSFGEDASEKTADSMTQDSFMVLPAGHWHALWIDSETIIELHSTGPFAITLLHPAQ
jgi:quercetin dioxygenase-like cupin family protein